MDLQILFQASGYECLLMGRISKREIRPVPIWDAGADLI